MKKNSTKYLLDPIHEEISISSLEQRIISSTLFNRLHYITQLSTVYFIYPTANHTRSAHSIGTMKVASKIFKFSLINTGNQIKSDFLNKMNIDINNILKNDLNNEINKRNDDNLSRWFKETKKDIELFNDLDVFDELKNFDLFFQSKNNFDTYQILLQAVRIAGLLHDIGHLPFSHLSEVSLENIYDLTLAKNEKDRTLSEQNFCNDFNEYSSQDKALHEILGKNVSDLIFAEILQDDLKNEHRIYILLLQKIVNNIFSNKTLEYKALHSIIDGMVDADRLDYVIRDTKNIGLKTISFNIKTLMYNFVLIEEEKSFSFGLNIKALNELERFLESRFHLYNNIIFSANAIKKYQILNQAIVRLAQERLTLTNTELKEFELKEKELKDYELPIEISGFWKFLKFISSNELNLDKTELLFQYDESWLLYILKMEYFRLNKIFLTKGNFDNVKQKKTYYGMREILFGESNFLNIWNDRHEFCEFLQIDLQDLHNITQDLFIEMRYMLTELKKFVKNHEEKYDMFFGIRKFKNGYNEEYNLIDTNLNKIQIKNASQIESHLKNMAFNEPPFYFYILKNNSSLENIKMDLKYMIFDLIITCLNRNSKNKKLIEKIKNNKKG